MCLIESDFKKNSSDFITLSQTYLAPETTLMELNRPYRFVWYLDILEIWAKASDQPLCRSDVMERSASPHLRRFLSNHKDSGDKESSSQLPTGTELCKTSNWRYDCKALEKVSTFYWYFVGQLKLLICVLYAYVLNIQGNVLSLAYS